MKIVLRSGVELHCSTSHTPINGVLDTVRVHATYPDGRWVEQDVLVLPHQTLEEAAQQQFSAYDERPHRYLVV